MAEPLRCDKCGRLIDLEANKDGLVTCPSCHQQVRRSAPNSPDDTVVIPFADDAVTKSLAPAEQSFTAAETTPANANQPAQSEQPTPAIVLQPAQVMQAGPDEPDVVIGIMTKLMPWATSIFVHAAVLLILGFVTMVIFPTRLTPSEVTVADAAIPQNITEQLDMASADDSQLQQQAVQQFTPQSWTDTAIPPTEGGGNEGTDTDAPIGLEGNGIFGAPGKGGGSGGDGFGFTSGGGGTAARFMGIPGSAYHIVYVCDRSGSMLDSLDDVKAEIIRSISRLQPVQTFHIIFFAAGKPVETEPKTLVYANEASKRGALLSLRKVVAEGQTDPMPALRRAFDALAQAPNKNRGKLIYLLTDGEFPDNDEVLKQIRVLNKDKAVCINTILYKHRSESSVAVLEAIAKENRGVFKFIEDSP